MDNIFSNHSLINNNLVHQPVTTNSIQKMFDKFTFVDIYNDGGMNAIYNYIGSCDKCHDFKILRQFYLNYNLCDHTDNYPTSLRYSSGIIRAKSDIETLFQIVILPMHYGEMYKLGQSRKKKYNGRGGSEDAIGYAIAGAVAAAAAEAEEIAEQQEEANYITTPVDISLGTFNTLEAIAAYCNQEKGKAKWSDDNITELCTNLNNHVDFRDGEAETAINLEGTVKCPLANNVLKIEGVTRSKSFVTYQILSVFLANMILDSYHDHKKIFKKSNFNIIRDCIKDLLLRNKTNTKGRVAVNKQFGYKPGGPGPENAEEIITEIKSYIKNVVYYNYFKKNAIPILDVEGAKTRGNYLKTAANRYIALDGNTFKLPLNIDKYHYNYLFDWYVELEKTGNNTSTENIDARKAAELDVALRTIQLPPIGNWRVRQERFDTTTCILDQYSNPNGGFLINSGNVEINVANAIDPGDSFRRSIYPKEYIDAILYNIFDRKKKYVIDNTTYIIKFNYDTNNLFTCVYSLDDDIFKLHLSYSGDESITNEEPFIPTVYSNSTVDAYYDEYKDGMDDTTLGKDDITLGKTLRKKAKLLKTEIKDILLSILIRKFMGDFGQMLYCSIPNINLNKDKDKDKEDEDDTKFIPFKVVDGNIQDNESEQHNIAESYGTKIFMTGDRAAINSGLLISILKEHKAQLNWCRHYPAKVYNIASPITINSNLHGDFRMFNEYGTIDETDFI